MFRKFLCAAVAMIVCVGIMLADEIAKGKVTKVDAEKNAITVNVDGKDKTFKVGKDVKVSGKAAAVKDIKEGATVTIIGKKADKEKKQKMEIQEVKVD